MEYLVGFPIRTTDLNKTQVLLRGQQLVEQKGVGAGVLIRFRNSSDQQMAFLTNAVALFFHLDSVNGMINPVPGVL